MFLSCYRLYIGNFYLANLWWCLSPDFMAAWMRSWLKMSLCKTMIKGLLFLLAQELMQWFKWSSTTKELKLRIKVSTKYLNGNVMRFSGDWPVRHCPLSLQSGIWWVWATQQPGCSSPGHTPAEPDTWADPHARLYGADGCLLALWKKTYKKTYFTYLTMRFLHFEIVKFFARMYNSLYVLCN